MKKENWIWMPHPGHFIAAFNCRFRMNTYVGDYIVSTVGEYIPQHKPDAEQFEEIGFRRLYETMVFKAERDTASCCPWRASSGTDCDFKAYNDPGAAFEGHMELCEKWAAKR
jgi:hypothetical protein